MRKTLLLLLLLAGIAMTAQRRITPVNTPATATQPVNEIGHNPDSLARIHVVPVTADDGTTILVDTISGTEFVDSTLPASRPIPKMEYPLLHSLSISADLAQGVMRLFGQHYGVSEIGIGLNLHNRYIPTLELGLGSADYTPDDNNYTYRSRLTPYLRIGADYNFFYNSNPDYLLVAGIRYGFAPLRWRLTDVTVTDSYWGGTLRYDTPWQSGNAGYFEVLLGVKVRLLGDFSLGWTIRYHSLLHDTNTPYGNAWYIPGFGSRSSALGLTFSLSYTIPLHKKKPTVDAQEQSDDPFVELETSPSE